MTARRNPEIPPFNVQCPECLELRGRPCRTLTTKRVTDTHMSRFDRAYGHKPKERP